MHVHVLTSDNLFQSPDSARQTEEGTHGLKSVVATLGAEFDILPAKEDLLQPIDDDDESSDEIPIIA